MNKKDVLIYYEVNDKGIHIMVENKLYFIDWQTLLDNANKVDLKMGLNNVIVRKLGVIKGE